MNKINNNDGGGDCLTPITPLYDVRNRVTSIPVTAVTQIPSPSFPSLPPLPSACLLPFPFSLLSFPLPYPFNLFPFHLLLNGASGNKLRKILLT